MSWIAPHPRRGSHWSPPFSLPQKTLSALLPFWPGSSKCQQCPAAQPYPQLEVRHSPQGTLGNILLVPIVCVPASGMGERTRRVRPLETCRWGEATWLGQRGRVGIHPGQDQLCITGTHLGLGALPCIPVRGSPRDPRGPCSPAPALYPA